MQHRREAGFLATAVGSTATWMHLEYCQASHAQAQMTDASQVKCSLRSLGQLDTTAISKPHGGGGHLNASSFVVAANTLCSWTVAG